MINHFKIKSVFILYCLFSPILVWGQDDITFSTPAFAPFYSSVNTQLCKGVTINIFSQLLEGTNRHFKYVPYPYARMLHSLKTGQLDVALIFKNSMLAEYVDYIGPVSKARVVVLVNNKNIMTNYDDLYKLRSIAVIRSADFGTKFDNDNSLIKVEVEDYTQAIEMFKLGRVDGVVGSIVGLDYQLRIQNIDVNILKNAYVLGEKELWLHLSKKVRHKSLKSQLSLAVKKYYQEDLLYKVYLQFVDECLLINENSLGNKFNHLDNCCI